MRLYKWYIHEYIAYINNSKTYYWYLARRVLHISPDCYCICDLANGDQTRLNDMVLTIHAIIWEILPALMHITAPTSTDTLGQHIHVHVAIVRSLNRKVYWVYIERVYRFIYVPFSWVRLRIIYCVIAWVNTWPREASKQYFCRTCVHCKQQQSEFIEYIKT